MIRLLLISKFSVQLVNSVASADVLMFGSQINVPPAAILKGRPVELIVINPLFMFILPLIVILPAMVIRVPWPSVKFPLWKTDRF